MKSKIYYFAPVYPFLLAAGAVAIERWVNQRRLRWLKLALPAVLVAGGLAIAPAVLPVLPIDKTDAYITAATGGLLKNAWEVTSTFHDERGWENQAKVVAEVFHRLSPQEQADCIIFAGNFGEAGAIDFYGPALGLPPVTAIHQNYYFWGPPAKSGNLVIFCWRRAGYAASGTSGTCNRRRRLSPQRRSRASRTCPSIFAGSRALT